MKLSRPLETATDVMDELSRATVVHRDAQEVAHKSAARWRRAVAAAIDAGVPQKIVADLAGVSAARVHAVVVREYSAS